MSTPENSSVSLQAVVSLLDKVHDRQVRELWALLEHNFGLTGIYAEPYPHISYHIAQGYDEGLEQMLKHFASTKTTFRVRTSGLGIFSGEKPILYLPVIRSSSLNHFHQQLWSKLAKLAKEPNIYYQPSRWLPHITLAHGDLSHELLPKLMNFLSKQTFDWEINIDNLALVYTAAQDQGLQRRFALAAEQQQSLCQPEGDLCL